jgi:hypothetical protein
LKHEKEKEGGRDAMNYLLCKHKVANYAKWKRVFDSDAAAARKAGMHLLHIFRDAADPKIVMLLIKVDNVKKAEAFIDAPDAGDYAKRAGVIGDPEIWFLRE